MKTIKVPRIKQTLTDKRIKGILMDVQFMAVISQLIENRFQYNLFDANLRNPIYRNNARQIITSAGRIKKEISNRFKLVKQEELEHDVSIQLDRVISFFMMLPADAIDEIMSGLERQLEEVRKEKEA